MPKIADAAVTVLRTGLALALAVGMSACMPRQEPAALPDAAHNSRNSLDWAGTYEGVTPCADCPGIRMQLTLQADGRYQLRTQYLERQVAPTSVTGRFSWNADGNAITLDAAGSGQQFRVGEGRLLQMNRDGSAPSWNTPYRVLTRQKSP